MQSFTIAAFTAGLVSFLSPCVLPLVPGYISLISGTGVEELRQRDGKLMRSVLLNSVLFILGFSAVFLALGAVATTLGQLVRQHIALLSRIAGVVIVVLGLHQTGLLPIRWLYSDKRFHGMPTGAAGTRAFLVGSAFGFGWTPCAGPILAVILTLAAAESTVAKGVSLLAVYALGLALPFLLTALSIRGFLAFYARFRRYLHNLEIVSGVVMIAVGSLIFSGHFILLNNWLNRISFFQRMAERFLSRGRLAFFALLIVAAALLSLRTTKRTSSSANSVRPLNLVKVGFQPGNLAPDFELRSLHGRTVTLSGLRGKPVLLNFWATWCAPCRVEMPWLVQLDQQYRAQGVQIIGVSLDDAGTEKDVAAFAKDKRVKYEVLFGNSSVANTYGGVRFMPQSFFIDREGKITKTAIGLTNKNDLEDGIKALLVQ